MAEMVDKQLGNFIGRFLEYDVNSNTALWRQCMRIRVAVDVRVPLVRYKMIKLRSGTLHRVSFNILLPLWSLKPFGQILLYTIL